VQGAPDGSYRVLVDYWSSCGVPATDFVVTVNVRDTEPQTFSGSFTGTGDTGDAGAGEPITTFTSGPGARGGGTRVLGTFEIAQGAVVHVK